MEENRTEITLAFLRKELLYDIRNYAYIEGEVLGEENQHAQHTLVDIGEDGNVDRINRILAVVFSGVIELLYPFTRQEPEESCIHDVMFAPEEYVFRLSVPSWFSQTTAHLLSKLIHELMVYRCLYDWLGITNPAAAGKWKEKAEAVKEEIERVKRMRGGVTKRRLCPF